MVSWRRDPDGYLLIDQTDSPGFAPAVAVEAGRRSIAPHVGPGKKFEAATLYCNHCERIVVKNPDRTRDRARCWKCDHFICDWCKAELIRTGVCKPFKQVIDEFYDDAAKSLII